MIYLIVSGGGLRLGNDGRWRSFAHFGCTKGCVKEYRSKAAADRKARLVKGFVAGIPNGYSVDAVGQVTDENDNKKGKVSDFIITSPVPQEEESCATGIMVI